MTDTARPFALPVDDTLDRLQDGTEPCRLDPDAWFPEKGEPIKGPKVWCGRCHIQQECADFAVRHGIRHGVWGGLGPLDRRKVRDARAADPDVAA